MGNRVAPPSRPSSYPQVTGQSTSPKQGGPNGLRGEERAHLSCSRDTSGRGSKDTHHQDRSVRRDVAVARGLLGPRAQTSPGSRKGRSTSRDEPAPGPTRQWAQGHAVARAAAACPPPPGGLHIELLIPTPNGGTARRVGVARRRRSRFGGWYAAAVGPVHTPIQSPRRRLGEHGGPRALAWLRSARLGLAGAAYVASPPCHSASANQTGTDQREQKQASSSRR